MLRREELSKRLDLAVEARQVTRDSARLVLGWIDASGRIAAPNERGAELAQEVLGAVGLEYWPASATDSEKMEQTKPLGENAASKPSGDGRRPGLSAAGLSRSATKWAENQPEESCDLLIANAVVIGAHLLAPDAEQSPEGGRLLRLLSENTLSSERYARLQRKETTPGSEMRTELLRLAGRLPSSEAVDGEPVSVLAAARRQFGIERNGGLPGAAENGYLPSGISAQMRLSSQRELQRQLALGQPKASRLIADRAPWLEIWDRLGGNSMAPGRGAPLALRLWIEVLAWAPPAARRGALVELSGLTVRDLVAAAWPEGWHRARQLPRLVLAIDQMHCLGYFEDGRTRWRPVVWPIAPALGASLSDPVVPAIRLLPVEGSGRGAPFNRKVLRSLGLHSAPAYRAYLGLVELWDRTRRHGRMPWKPPKAKRALPWPTLNPEERRRLVFGADSGTSSAVRRRRQADANAALERLADEGVIELRRDERDPRIWQAVRSDLRA